MRRIIIAAAPPLSPDLPFEGEKPEGAAPSPTTVPEKATADKDVRPLQPTDEQLESVGRVPPPVPAPEKEFERVTKPPSQLEFINSKYPKWDKIRFALEGTPDQPNGYLLRFTYSPLKASAGETVQRTIDPQETFPVGTGNYILHGIEMGTNKHKSFITSRIGEDVELIPKGEVGQKQPAA